MGTARTVEHVVVDVARSDFLKVLQDYESMPEFMEELTDIKVEKKEGQTYTVTYFVSLLGRSISYTLRLTHNPPGEVRWELVKGDFMKKNEGRWILEELSPTQTKATYEIEMGFPMLVPGAVVGQLQKTSLPKMLRQFKARAEEMYGE